MRRWLSALLLIILSALSACDSSRLDERDVSVGAPARRVEIAAGNEAARRYLDWVAAQPTTTTTTISDPPPAVQAPDVSPPASGAVGDLFVFLANCETGWVDGVRYPGGKWDHYTASYEGAFGFTHQTWDAYKPAGWPEDANLATPEQQTEVARILYGRYGVEPWPVCGQRARAAGLG